jgi:environmental stress-induced protein Ves
MIIQKKEYRRSTWKNGLGFTDEIAIHPPGSSLAKGDFLWRLSTAKIEKSSPFSLFPNHDRSLVILKGAGMKLAHSFEAGEPEDVVELAPLEPYEFPGDVKSRCELDRGSVQDFSIISRAGEVEVSFMVQELGPDEEFNWSAQGTWNFAFPVDDGVETGAGDVGEGDILSVGPGEVHFRAGPAGAKILLISLESFS